MKHLFEVRDKQKGKMLCIKFRGNKGGADMIKKYFS
jgi:hypothetical protein